MRKTIIILGALVLVGMATMACADSVKSVKEYVTSAEKGGKTVKQTRDIASNVTTINISSCVDVHYTQGSTPSLRVVAPANVIDKVVTEVKGKQLDVTLKGHFTVVVSGDLDVYVTLPNLSKVNVAGSADFEADGKVKASSLSLNVAGSGDIDMKSVECDNLTASVAGSGDIDIDRLKAQNASLSVAGSGDVEATLDGVKQFKASVAGSGDLDLKCIDCGHGEVSVLGSGEAKLSGKVRSLSSSTSGVGAINTHGLTVVESK